MTGQPSTIGRYQIRQRLGAGGFATVYRAHDPVLDIERALKVLHPHLAGDPAIRERFIREGRALARIHHPNLVQVHDAGESDGAVYLAMELIEGISLETVLAERGPLPVSEVAAIVEQTARALDAVHAHNLVHRDVKPDNILIESRSSRVVLLDLGVARDLATATAGTWIVGTPSFMAPEQVRRDGRVTVRTDVYQLGATIYMALSGRRPFEGDTLQVLDAVRAEPPPDLRTLRPDLPPAVIATVAQAMAKDAAFRPATATELAAHLRAAAGILTGAAADVPTVHHPASAAPALTAAPTNAQPHTATATQASPTADGIPPGASAPRRAPRALWLIAAAVLGIVAVIAAAVLLRPRNDGTEGAGPIPGGTTNSQVAAQPETSTATLVPSLTAGSPSPSAALALQPPPVPASPSPSPPASPPAARDAAPTGVVVVKPYGAAVRISPASDARIAVTVGCGATLRVLGASAGWYRVALDATQAIAAGVLEGWVGQLRAADAATTPRPDCTGAVLFRVNDSVVTSVQSGCLSLRETPSRTATILRCVENGTRYAVVNGPIEVDGEDWFELSDPRIGRGWSLAQFLLPAR
jgi:serine/threonine-protein kinase